MSPATPFTLDDAREIALDVHSQQTDKIGRPYMEHVESVALGLADFDLDLQIAGLLHDVVEDSEEQTGRLIGIEELRERGVPERALDAIALVSNNLHPDGTTYLDKIARICESRDAALVKVADNAHNSLEERIAATGRPADPKYADARRLLYAAVPHEDIALILNRVNRPLLAELDG
jgi:(p)ppGpp synthase/HD superfamily hydrolase